MEILAPFTPLEEKIPKENTQLRRKIPKQKLKHKINSFKICRNDHKKERKENITKTI